MTKLDELRIRKAETAMDEMENNCRDKCEDDKNQDNPSCGAGLYV